MSPGLAIYAHPQSIFSVIRGFDSGARATGFETMTKRLAQSLTLAGTRLEQVLTASKQPPRWLVANQRTLEQLASELVAPDMITRQHKASSEGSADALSFVRDVLAKDDAFGDKER
jgi:hypothetical protein